MILGPEIIRWFSELMQDVRERGNSIHLLDTITRRINKPSSAIFERLQREQRRGKLYKTEEFGFFYTS